MTELEKDIYIQLLELHINELEWDIKLRDINKVLDDAIKNHPKPTPFVPIQTPPHWNKNCSACGLKLDGVMGYVCPNSRCPSGLGNVFVD